MDTPFTPTPDRLRRITKLLEKHQHYFFPILGGGGIDLAMCRVDLTEKNTSLKKINFQETLVLDQYISQYLEEKQATVGAGGYLEKRIIYSRSETFGGTEPRCIHLGIDLWAPAFTPIFAPLGGKIHSLKDNNAYGDYGPTVILEHQLEGITFFTLYGHLSRRSLSDLEKEQWIPRGTPFTELGPAPENGDWPPHLHFQIILDMMGKAGDFPGVAAPSELEKYKCICPDPNLILNLPVLKINKFENGNSV